MEPVCEVGFLGGHEDGAWGGALVFRTGDHLGEYGFYLRGC